MINEVAAVGDWFNKSMQLQKQLALHQDPVMTVADIRSKTKVRLITRSLVKISLQIICSLLKQFVNLF